MNMSRSIADKFVIGTSGYSFSDWVGPFYPPGTRSGEMLAEYAKHFATVELNFTYYRMPTARTLAGIAARTPDDFSLWIKANQETTHRANRDAAAPFLQALAPLTEVGKLAGVLMQFPQSFRRTVANRRYLADALDDFALVATAVEFRHNSWQADETLAGLRERGVTLVIPDVPDIKSLYRHEPTVSSSFGYLRMHSRNADNWYAGPGDRYDYRYSDAELTGLIDQWTPIAELVEKIFVYFNNCHAAQAAENAETFKRLLARIA